MIIWQEIDGVCLSWISEFINRHWFENEQQKDLDAINNLLATCLSSFDINTIVIVKSVSEASSLIGCKIPKHFRASSQGQLFLSSFFFPS